MEKREMIRQATSEKQKDIYEEGCKYTEEENAAERKELTSTLMFSSV
jgi:hypothetical protein